MIEVIWVGDNGNNNTIYYREMQVKDTGEIIMNKCECCGVETTNPKYCGRSCAARMNNTKRPKRQLTEMFCKHCGVSIPRSNWKERRTTCNDCDRNKVDWSKVTYGQTKAKRTYQIHSRIRDIARQMYKNSGLPLKCEECGYDKHVIIHHKKPIGEHEDSATITEINRMENLMCLCPNHHWEIHNGIFFRGMAAYLNWIRAMLF